MRKFFNIANRDWVNVIKWNGVAETVWRRMYTNQDSKERIINYLGPYYKAFQHAHELDDRFSLNEHESLIPPNVTTIHTFDQKDHMLTYNLFETVMSMLIQRLMEDIIWAALVKTYAEDTAGQDQERLKALKILVDILSNSGRIVR